MSTLSDKITRFEADADLAHQVVHAGPDVTVQTEGGPVRSLAKVLADADASIRAQAPSLSQLLDVGGAERVTANRPASSTGITLAPAPVNFFIRSAPIDVREALPGNFVTDASVNYTVYVQKILDYLRDQGGGVMRLPPNLAILISALKVYSGTEIIGPDWTSKLVALPGTYGISVNQGSGGSPDTADNQRNIRLAGFELRGQADQPTFLEHAHLLNINATTDFLAEMMRVRAWQGDAAYLGSSNIYNTERHNERIRFDRMTFDGVNAENRNAVSIIDGTDVSITRSKMLNTTRPGQPGAVDVEPNGFAWTLIRRILVEDCFIKGGYGTGVTLLLPSNTNLTTPITDIEVNRVVVENKDTGFGALRKDAVGTVQDNFRFKGMTVKNCQTPFIFDNTRGVDLMDSYIEGATKKALLGYVAEMGNYDFRSSNVRMVRCGKLETNALNIGKIDGLLMDRWLFEDCGREDGAGGRAIYFANGTGKNIELSRTIVRSPNAKTTAPIGVEAATYALDNATCKRWGNNIMAGTDQFLASGMRNQSAAPTTGTWAADQEVFASAAVLAGKGIEKWKCTVTGAPGTWEPVLFHPFRRMVSRNYQLVENFDAGVYDIFSINIQAANALTYNAPTNGVAGQEITIRVKNISGVAMGAITWNAAFKMSGWTNPGVGKSRSITFVSDGTNWIEISQTTGDVAN